LIHYPLGALIRGHILRFVSQADQRPDVRDQQYGTLRVGEREISAEFKSGKAPHHDAEHGDLTN
jgi:hypothetical protein